MVSRSFRGFSSFRARVFWSVVPIVVSFLVFQAWMNAREHRRLITEEFEKRGLALASNLGFTSELGAFSEDRQLLEAAMKGALRDPDVAYVVIHGEKGKVLASGGREVAIAGSGPETIPDKTYSRQAEHGGQKFIEFRSPIMSEQQQQNAEDLLMGTKSRTGGQGAKPIGGVRLGLSLPSVA